MIVEKVLITAKHAKPSFATVFISFWWLRKTPEGEEYAKCAKTEHWY